MEESGKPKASRDHRTWPVTDYEEMAARYDAGRALPLESLTAWREALYPHLASARGRTVLDLGSGTGVWSVAMAEWFGCRVVALEPSEGMLREASAKRSHPMVAYVQGQGERLPLEDQSCAAAWLSTVVHHLSDVPRCARELRRVVAPGGPVLLRNAFSGRTDDVLWLRFFPRAVEIAAKRWPSLDEVTGAFTSAGHAVESVKQVPQISAESLKEYAERIRVRADSTLQLLDDDEFERGIAELEGAAAAETSQRPVVDRLDLIVFR